MFKSAAKPQHKSKQIYYLPMKTMTKFSSVALAAVFGLAFAASAQDAAPAAGTLPPASTKTGVTYDTDIKPIFTASCGKCHGDTKPRGGITLTTLEGTLKGGDDGKILTVGDSSKGSLVNAVAHIGDPGSFMPKGKGAAKLTDDQIGLIRAWIDQGAK
jgi:mono/diheme cytochrome c family protein